MAEESIQPAVTVLLPFFQAGEELDRAIKSIVDQTFSAWDLLLISNNGSKTGTEIARKWASLDKRIKLIYETRQGIAFALNTGLQQINTSFVARMDADDFALPERLER